MIEHLDDLLRQLLMQRLPGYLPAPENVRFEPPNHEFPPLVGHVDGYVASVYLIDVRENRRLRSNERRLDPGTRTWLLPPHRVDCHYLITAWSGATAAGGIDPTVEEHKLLSRIAAALLEEGELSFARVLAAADLLTIPAELREVGLPISVGPGEGFHKLAEFWGTMGATAPWRPAVYLVVTLPLAREAPIEPGPPVETILVDLAGFPSADLLEEMFSDIGGHVVTTGGVAIAGAWIELQNAAGLTLAHERSGAAGEFVLSNLEPGDYRIVARANGFAPSAPTPISIPAQALDGYQIVLT